MIVQMRNGLQGSFDVIREFLIDRFKYFIQAINISDLVLGISLQPGKDFFKPCLIFL
jgi:hypothetical protein